MRFVLFLKKCFLAVVLVALLAGFSAAQTSGQRPTLWVVAIGLSEYQNPVVVNAQGNPVLDKEGRPIDMRNGVRFAAKDARDIAAALQAQEGRLFGRVVAKTLTNSQATKSNIEEVLSWLRGQPIQSGDYVVVFVAGHGGPAQGQYYFSTYDFNINTPLGSTDVSGATLVNTLAGLPGTRLLILDTCGAASVAQGTQARAAGIITIAGCMSNQGSQENHQLRNGRLTAALVEGLNGKADVNRDGVVTLSELYAYVYIRIAQLVAPEDILTDRVQTPTVGHPRHVPGNLPVAVISGPPGNSPPAAQPPAIVPPVTTGPGR